jgi:hypothetical protein
VPLKLLKVLQASAGIDVDGEQLRSWLLQAADLPQHAAGRMAAEWCAKA